MTLQTSLASGAQLVRRLPRDAVAEQGPGLSASRAAAGSPGSVLGYRGPHPSQSDELSSFDSCRFGKSGCGACACLLALPRRLRESVPMEE